MIAWGAKVSKEFKDKLLVIADDQIGIDPEFLMACMAFESGETFSPSVRNAAGSGAVGLIQFMPQTAALLGTSIEDLAAMTAEQQLDYVDKYFAPHRGRIHNLADLYMAILWPAAIGQPDYFVLFDQANAAHPKQYLQNRGLDFNHDGKVTKSEAAYPVAKKLDKGRLPEFIG
jgi:hypothetical protein